MARFANNFQDLPRGPGSLAEAVAGELGVAK